MAKSPATTKTETVAEEVAVLPAPEPVVVPEPVVRISIQEFCVRMNDMDRRRYAGLYAFQREEEREGRASDTMERYDARYKAFLVRPTAGPSAR